jgi:hypothetical protein
MIDIGADVIRAMITSDIDLARAAIDKTAELLDDLNCGAGQGSNLLHHYARFPAS